MKIGLDIGSTTIKCVVLNDKNEILYKSYNRHFSQIKEKAIDLLLEIKKHFKNEEKFEISISGSAGMGLAEGANITFIQEVYATRIAINTLIPNTDVVIELGGEDAKILFLKGIMEVRMNGSCAGGTGAFIDQMATLLDVSLEQMNTLSQKHEKVYTIASRCGVFAKTDIQPLLNQGAKKEDVSASIFNAVVNQTIAGLAQGREIEGQVVYLGGPLTFFSELRNSFDETLNIKGICPENSLYFVALGSAFACDKKSESIDTLIENIKKYQSKDGYSYSEPLFKNKEEYDEFVKRHDKDKIDTSDADKYKEEAYIGIDSGSTTIKAVVIDKDEKILCSRYLPNKGNPVSNVKNFLEEFYKKYPQIQIKSSCVTGYGEEIIKNAFNVDFGLVETMAHFIAAKKFKPDVDFIIDIGGQDIKCFKIKNGAIDNIFLNEACSSGCGSFLQTFAGALNYEIEDFAKLGLFAKKPVDLGSRCTVFMNSSVKQAQKDGATVENISAGLSMSVVKNALYKVIRTNSVEELGENIVVQGGTFLNDAVLRAFEKEINKNVIRPNISGLMGAYGAALYAKKYNKNDSKILNLKQLESFIHKVNVINCKGCSNHCQLTVNTFNDNKKFISGNRCEKPLAIKNSDEKYNIYEYKLQLLEEYKKRNNIENKRGVIGIPMGLNMYELLPFWYRFFTELKFELIVTTTSTRKIYIKGQHTIPSDTVCYPAKLIHGHIEELLEQDPDAIFYPCMTYNFNENLGDNHYNCPVVAYYPEVIKANVQSLEKTKFIYDYVGLHRKKEFPKKIHKILKNNFGEIPFLEIKRAANLAFLEYENYMNKVSEKGKEFIKIANEKQKPIIILSGRPYHADPEINHGIDKLICNCGAVVISEDVVSKEVEKFKTSVLNQWTYHSRLYSAAKYIANKPNMNLVQLVSFGCGIDAITTDEVRRIIESEGKIYTQIKIDEITNLGAVKIRLRSLFSALEQNEVK